MNITQSIFPTPEIIRAELCKREFAFFISEVMPEYDMQWFHKYICERLEAFSKGWIKKLMILMPPQHGKSQLSSRLYPAWEIGMNPESKIGVVTYNDTFARAFNRHIQRFIDSPAYVNAFPNTKLAGSKITTPEELVNGTYSRTANTLEIVNHKGSITTVGRDGQIIGLQIDTFILDDLYKSREEAMSIAVSEKIYLDYTEVFCSRMHNKSKQLMVNTRWDERDLAGRLLAKEGNEWEVIRFPAIRKAHSCAYDPRPVGAALWPERHSLERMEKIRDESPVTYNSMYDQDPKPNEEILCIKEITIVDEWPKEKVQHVTWGLDFGFTNDPTCLIKCGFWKEGSKKFVCYEQLCYAPGISMPIIRDILKSNGYDRQPVFCDHSIDNINELILMDVAAYPARKGEGSIIAGLATLSEYEKQVTARSKDMITEQRKYQYITYGEIITNQPVDKDNHAWDAARYGTHGWKFMNQSDFA